MQVIRRIDRYNGRPVFAQLTLYPLSSKKSYALQYFSIDHTSSKVPWTQPTQHSKLHLDRFSRVCTAHSRVSLQFTKCGKTRTRAIKKLIERPWRHSLLLFKTILSLTPVSQDIYSTYYPWCVYAWTELRKWPAISTVWLKLTDFSMSQAPLR